jgi:hypothetical protein
MRKSIPWKSILYGILGICVLLAANYAVYRLMLGKGLDPISAFSATFIATWTPPVETSVSETVLNGVSTSEATFTLTPSVQAPPTETPLPEAPGLSETPIMTETPTPAASLAPSLTPAFGSCQYTLKPGPNDFLYSIYWKWQINKNIPYLKNYYAGISCAVILSNKTCDYQAAYPGITQPGWILVLPGVTPNMCLYHGGIPLS